MVLGTNIQDQARANLKRFAEDPSTNQDIKSILENVIKSNTGKTREQIIAIFEERKKQYVLGLQRRAIEGARAGALPGMRKGAIEELIEERLKMQEAKKLNIVVSDDDVNRALKGVADRNKMSESQFAEHLKGMGGDVAIMKSRFQAAIAWREVVRRKYGHTISVSGRDSTASSQRVLPMLQRTRRSCTSIKLRWRWQASSTRRPWRPSTAKPNASSAASRAARQRPLP